jgi:hypothetical protein
MSLPTLLKVQKLQAALHAKAKGSSSSQWRGELAQEQSLSSRGPTHGARLRQWWRKKHKVQGLGTTRYPAE